VRPSFLADSPQRVQDVEVSEAKTERSKRGDERAPQVFGGEQQAPDDLERTGVQLRVACCPGFADAIDGVRGDGK
jgi:hypothetical protein